MKLQAILLFLCLSLMYHFNIFSDESTTMACSAKIIPTPSEEQQKGGGNFQFEFHNFPKNQEILVSFTRGLKNNPKQFRDLHTIIICDDDSILMGKEKFNIYELGSIGFFEGEKVTYKFRLKNGSVIAETSYYPLPICAKGCKGTFSIYAEVAPGTNYLLHFDGLEPNEEIQFSSTSAGEKMSSKIRIPSGSPFLYMPHVLNVDGGIAQLVISRSNGDSATLELFWGSEALKRHAHLFRQK